MALLLNASKVAQTHDWRAMLTAALDTAARLSEAYIAEKQKALGVAADGIVGPRTLEALKEAHTPEPAPPDALPNTQVVDFRKLDVE